MRPTLLLTAFCLLTSFGPTSVCVLAQPALASNTPDARAQNDALLATLPPPTTESIVLAGKITNPAGPLPGAVVILTATKQMAVTNADGEFEFVVPADAGALQALVTYAGYADEKMTLNASQDESTVSLTNARVIVVSRKQQLKKFLKTARKQVKRDLRQIRD